MMKFESFEAVHTFHFLPKEEKNNLKESNKGITLIALVVTIVVLLILAGITIQLVLTDGGLFSQAQKSKEQTKIGELLDKFNVSEAAVSLEKLGKPSLEDYITQIRDKEGYVIEAQEQENGHYQVTTEEGYVFDISIIEGTNTNDIVIEYIGKADNLPPIIEVKNVTTNSAQIEVKRTEGATSIKYEYKKQGEDNYQTATGNGNTCNYTGLENNTIYDIKVTIIRNGKEAVAEQSIVIGKIPTGVIKLKSTTWSGGKATVIVYHEETGNYRIEWKKEGELSWNHGEMGQKEISIPNLNHGDTVNVRLGDGISGGENDASISIIDDKEPQASTISFTPTAAKVGESITATVTLADNESGINSINSKYEFNNSSTPIGTADISKYTGGNFASGTSLSLKATTSGTWYLHVLSVDNGGNKKETVSQVINISKAEIANLDRGRGDIEIAFVNKSNTPINASSVPTPKLGTGMTAKKWNGTAWVNPSNTAPGGDWYNYENKEWANAQTADGSMWVWIPRYSYKIVYKDTSGKIIGYSDSEGILDSEGRIVSGTEKQGAVEVKGSLDRKQIEKYVLHPAFTVNEANGGWKEEIEGIWVAKFEASSVEGNSNNASGDNVTTKTIQVKPGVSSWKNITVDNMFKNCQNYNRALNSHMMKNSEWGAVAYLSKSKYGKEEEITINSNSSYYTGGGSGEAYVTNVGQSTTGNITGIYDISGGAYEYVASYVNNENSSLQSYGASLVNSSEKHLKQVYSKGSSDDREPNYQANKGRYGDAVYETSTRGDSDSAAWFGDYSKFPYAEIPFFTRGGNFNVNLGAGAFYFGHYNANSTGTCGFRPVLATN